MGLEPCENELSRVWGCDGWGTTLRGREFAELVVSRVGVRGWGCNPSRGSEKGCPGWSGKPVMVQATSSELGPVGGATHPDRGRGRCWNLVEAKFEQSVCVGGGRRGRGTTLRGTEFEPLSLRMEAVPQG